MKKLTSYKKDSKLLLVEDDLLARNKIKKILKRHYKNITDVENGQVALELFRHNFIYEEEKFDLVITDIDMPITNGIDLLESIRQIDEFIPCMVITAKKELDYILQVVKLDISDYILKPINIDELIYSVNRVLNKKYKKEFIGEKSDYISLLNNYYWNNSKQALYKNNQLIKLTKNEIILLDLLTTQINEIVNIEYIIYAIWIHPLDMESAHSRLKNLISRLRFKTPELIIESIYGLGYRIKEKNAKEF